MYGASFVKSSAVQRMFLSFVGFFVRSESPFLRPDPQQRQAVARRSCQGWPFNNLSTCFALARPYLDRFEHDGTLRAVATTIRGEPAFGRGSIAPQPCIRWVQDPNHDAVIRIGSEAPRRRSHSTFRHDSHESPRDPATSNRRRRPVTSGRIGPKLLGAFSDLRSLRRAQNDAVRYHAFSHQPPQGDQ